MFDNKEQLEMEIAGATVEQHISEHINYFHEHLTNVLDFYETDTNSVYINKNKTLKITLGYDETDRVIGYSIQELKKGAK